MNDNPLFDFVKELFIKNNLKTIQDIKSFSGAIKWHEFLYTISLPCDISKLPESWKIDIEKMRKVNLGWHDVSNENKVFSGLIDSIILSRDGGIIINVIEPQLKKLLTLVDY